MINKQVVYILLIAGVMMWGGYQLIPTWTDYQDTHRELVHLDNQLLESQTQNERLRTQIHRLRTDPRAIERVAREKFSWARPTETIYDFSRPVGSLPTVAPSAP